MVLRPDPRHLGIPVPEIERYDCPKCKGIGKIPWASKDGASKGFMWCEECKRTGKKQPPAVDPKAATPPAILPVKDEPKK